MLKKMALSGITVVEISGLAPAPFCGMILSDFGARVIRVDKIQPDPVNPNTMARGKESISLDLKKEDGVGIMRKLCKNADVLIEPFRTGVMEKLSLGPSVLLEDNPRLIYARLTGYGQSGTMSNRAGHDINYLAISGLLSQLGRRDEKPYFPINLLADFGGGGLMCALGIAMALIQRASTGVGQVIDANMVEGASYLGSFLWHTKGLPIWGKGRGEGWLDGGAHFYDTYQTADGKYMAIGAIEPHFYAALLKGLGLTHDEAPQFGEDTDKLCDKFSAIFATKTQAEWCDIFDNVDACVTPVLSMDEALKHEHNKERTSFVYSSDSDIFPQPRAAPVLSHSPPVDRIPPQPSVGQHTTPILQELGYSAEQLQHFFKNNIVLQDRSSKL